MENWSEVLAPGGTIDKTARLLVTLIFFIWNVFDGAKFHTPYSYEWVTLYPIPYWRLFLVLTLIAAASWCPRVGVMVGLALFFYLGDMFHLTQQWTITQTQQQNS